MASVTFPSSACVFLVVEGAAACAHWPAHLGAPPEDGWAVLEQEEWEPLALFAGRLSDVLARLAVTCEKPVVTLVTSRFWDAGSVGTRRRLALDVLSHLAQCGGGTLLLSHGHQHDAACREALACLATELAPEWKDSGVTVSSRLEERARRPETRKASSPALSAVGPTAPG